LYLKYILSILILVTTLFSNNFEVVESFESSSNNSYNSTINNPVTITKKRVIETNVNKKETILPKNTKKHKKPRKKDKIVKKVDKLTHLKHTKIDKKKPKLVIIIDDVSHKFQLNLIKSLPFKVTPSIFPPTKMNMKSYKLAKGLKHFMIHLPLESNSKQMNKIYKIIKIDDTKAKIEKRVKYIRRLFPHAKYINNHTGSKFSENYKASKRLYKTLLKNGFIFVDSRTSRNTKFPKIAREFGKRYLKSDLFIDNKLSVNKIKEKIKEAVNLAKRRGYAVIIGHPHPQTFKALKQSSKLLKTVRTIYIDEL